MQWARHAPIIVIEAQAHRRRKKWEIHTMFNVKTKNSYQGQNITKLEEAAEEQGFSSNVWGTFLQWKEAGRMVQKGQTGTRIIKVVDKKIYDAQGKETKKKVVKENSVFNLQQTKAI